MKNFAIRLFINALALSIAAWWVPGIRMSDGFLDVLWIALVFGLVNAILKPVLMLLSLPLLFVTLGLFTFVINAALLMLTAALVTEFAVDGWGSAFIGSIAVSVVSLTLGLLAGDDDD
ncbi:MAG TPA: phage holin family protein [Longimicrobiales bacterium]|nr:phage holin family protein [Longimicrobiales bacterium]